MKWNAKILSWSLFILMACYPTVTVVGQYQKISFEEVLRPDGNPLGKITAITQDKQGFMWFADYPNNMLVRYDGSYMEYYRFDPENPNSPGGAYPHAIYAAPSGDIWIGYIGGGLDRFDPYSNTFTHYVHDPEDPESLVNDIVHTVLVDSNGMVWAGTSEGLDRLDPSTGKFTHFQHDENDATSLSHNVVRTLYEDRSGTLWAGTGFVYNHTSDEGGLNRYHPETGTFTRYLHDPEDPTSLIGTKVTAILEDRKGNFWVGTEGDGLHTMDRETGRFTRHSYDPDYPEKLSRPALSGESWAHISFLVEDSTGRIWIGTIDNGVNRYDPETGEVTHFGSSSKNREGVVQNEDWMSFTESNSAWCAYSSPDGLIWLNTEKDPRLFKIDLFRNTFKMVRETGVRDFLETPPNLLWKGTDEGLVRKDLETGAELTYQNIPDDPGSLSHNYVSSIAQDSSGTLWIGTAKGLNEFDPASGDFKRYMPDPGSPGSLSDEWVSDVMVDSQGTVWVGTLGGGLHQLDRTTGNFRIFREDPQDTTSLYRNWITTLVEDPDGTLWAGGDGLNRYNPHTGKFDTYLHNMEVRSLLVDSGGGLWVGTDRGLFQYDPENNHFVNAGFPSKNTRLIEDLQHNLWIHNTNGLIRFNPRTGQTALFGKQYGIKSHVTSARSYPYRMKDGTLLFGTQGGYFQFNPEQFWHSQDTSGVYATELEISGSSELNNTRMSLLDHNGSKEAITLKADQNAFSIWLSAIDFRNSGRNPIQYMLEGYDYDWLRGSAEFPANYNRVPPGVYTFRIKALNSSSGIWSENSVQLKILPPWWATWWAYLIYGLLFISGMFLIHRVQRSRTIQKERERAKDKELAQAREIEKAYTELKEAQTQLIHAEKMASLGELTAGIAHEIQNPLNFVNNFSEVSHELIDEMKEELKNKDYQEVDAIADDLKQNLEKINHHGNRAGDIVRGMLQHSRSSDGKKEPTDLNALADEYLRLAYHGLRAKDKSFNATLETDFDPGLPEVQVVPQDIGRVLLNLLTNAFHAVNERSKKEPEGYEPTVWVRTGKTAHGVEITVRDNGGGIPEAIRDKIFQPFFTTKPAGQGTGLGLSLSFDMVKAHGGNLTVKSEEGSGTAFTLVLPG